MSSFVVARRQSNEKGEPVSVECSFSVSARRTSAAADAGIHTSLRESIITLPAKTVYGEGPATFDAPLPLASRS